MNRIDRLFNILLILQHKRHIRASELAEHFEVSERTIYRDMSALMQMGIPLLASAGHGYELLEGYYLPPLVFTPDEATALLLGGEMLIASGNFVEDTQKALTKLRVALPPQSREFVEDITQIIEIFQPNLGVDLQNPYLMQLREAIQQRLVVDITYQSRQSNEVTQRALEPHWLTLNQSAWYVTGYCRLRQARREFRLDRIESLHVSTEVFPVRPLFAKQMPKTRFEIRFSEQIVRWVYERQHYGFVEEVRTESLGRIMAYEVEQFSEIKAWLLSWGVDATLISPADYCAQVYAELQQMIANMSPKNSS